MESRKIRITFIDEMLATNPANKKLHEDYISSKAPDAESRAEELEHIRVDDMVEKEKMVFYRDEDGCPMLACYMIYGFFKSACGFLRKVKGTESSKIKAYKKTIDGLVKAFPNASEPRGRFLRINLLDGAAVADCQRPLRAQTPQGERVALSNSETVPAGAWFEFDLMTFDDTLWGAIEEWLDYGQYNGLGAWRSSGKGAFMWEYAE